MAVKELPAREANLFKKIARCYEEKQFRMGLKHCQKILSTPGLSNHGETLSMKALLLNATDKKQEAHEFARLGLRNSVTSHVCWHAYGMIHRSDKNYAEAAKCYKQALRIEKNNLQLLRDLSALQIQMRDLQGYSESRRNILTIRSSQRGSWLGYAVAEHLRGNLDLAVIILTSYEHTLDMPPRDETDLLDVGELSLYKTSLLQELGKLEEALEYLKASTKHITDKTAVREATLQLLTGLGRPEAVAMAREMFGKNPDNRDYLLGLEKAMGLANAEPEKRLAFYQSLEKEYPSSRVLRRVPLTLATGPLFETIADDYLRKGLRKGIVSLFRSIQSLYTSPEKPVIIEKLLRGYVANLTAHKKFDAAPSSSEELPSTMIWTLYALAQHCDRVGDYEQALVQINAAIEHTPTLVDLYMIKAKILKHQGNFAEAAKVMDVGRDLDTADRYLNCKAVKYFLRAGDIAKAETLAAMFTRDGNNDPIAQLSEMQCTWFEMEEARALMKSGATGRALKKLHSIDAHFTQYIDDQFDFHSFCFRKMTLRAYIRLLRFEDSLHGHKYFVRAALLAIETYVGLHDKPFVLEAEKAAADSLEGLSEADRKKALSKQRKAAKRAEAQAAPQEAKKGEDGKGEKKDTDPDGLLLAKTATPLEDALKFLRPLLVHARDNIEVHLAAFNIYSRKQKPLLMLQALVRANGLQPQHKRLIEARAAFLKLVETEGKKWDPKVVAAIRHEVTTSEAFKSSGVDLAKLF